MALSDEERRRLEKLEQELAAADPDLARKLGGLTRSRPTSGTFYGVLTAMAGFGLIVVGIITQLTVIGAIGFLLMVAGGHWFLNTIYPPPSSGGRNEPRKP